MQNFWCYRGHTLCKSGHIMNSGNIIITFSTPSYVGSPNFMLLDFLLWRENNFKLCYVLS